MSTATRRSRWTAAALLTAALTAGCSASEDPAPLPVPAATTAAPTATATAAALPSPVLSGVQGEVERAALGYFAALNQAFATGDTAAYAATFTSGCTACTRIKQRLDADKAEGNTLDGLRDEVSDLEVTVGENDTAFVDVEVDVPAYRRLGPDGQVLGTFTASSSTFTMTLNKAGGTWKVIDITDAAP